MANSGNNDNKIDFRSDTVTQPTAGMRAAMMAAPLGDDVLGDDPTVRQLEERCATLLGKEAALFVPSGSMANLLAIRTQTEAGNEIIAHEDSHIYQYEGAAFAALAGCSIRLLSGARGQFTREDFQCALRPVGCHFPISRLLVIENTQNKGGGSVWPLAELAKITAAAHALRLAVHLDGARLLNACAALADIEPREIAQHFDTVSMCFSKGLGAPVGSILAGTREMMERARRFRKMLGGGMRQSGILAAAALYALDEQRARLADDHANAKRIAMMLATIRGLEINPAAVETNILYFTAAREIHGSAASLVQRLDDAGVRTLATGAEQIRLVTHLDATGAKIEQALEIMRSVLSAD